MVPWGVEIEMNKTEGLVTLLSRSEDIAIIGASADSKKYGYQILRELLELDFKVYPVNSKYKTVLGVKCYKSIADIKNKLDVVSFVVPEKVSNIIVRNWPSRFNDTILWFQPGAYSDTTIKLCKNKHLRMVYGVCILKDALKRLRAR